MSCRGSPVKWIEQTRAAFPAFFQLCVMFAVNIGLGHAYLLISPNSLPLLFPGPTPSVFVQFGPVFLESRYSDKFRGAFCSQRD